MGNGLTHGDPDATATEGMLTVSLKTSLDPGAVILACAQKQGPSSVSFVELSQQDQLPTHWTCLDRHLGDLSPLPTQIQGCPVTFPIAPVLSPETPSVSTVPVEICQTQAPTS